MTLRIDVFNHIFPKPFFERLQQVVVNKGAVKRWMNIPFLHDLDVRFRMLERRPYDYFKMFWTDTAVFGSRAATECGLRFFGADQVVFASGAPFDPEGGPFCIRETMKVIDGLEIAEADRRKIY